MINYVARFIDQRLRMYHGITEYTTSEQCIFRMQVTTCSDSVSLPDGRIVSAGSRIIVLHLWNEHMPAFPLRGPTIGWARRIGRALDSSLCELDRHLSARPDLDDVLVIRAEMALATAKRRTQLLALANKYGFEPIEPAEQSHFRRLHRLGENILMAMLVLANNPASFRADTLRRSPTPVFVSRASLSQRIDRSRRHAASTPEGTSPEAPAP